MFTLLPPWMYRKRHFVVVEKDNSLYVTATDDSPDCFARDDSAVAVQDQDIHAQPSPESTWPGISPQLESTIKKGRTRNVIDTIYACIKFLLLYILVLYLVSLITYLAGISSIPQLSFCTVPIRVAMGLLAVKIAIFALSTRLLAHAEMATTGPLVVSYDEDFIAIGERKIPRRQVRRFHSVAFVGLGKRVCLWPVRDVSYGIQVEAVSGAFVLGFVEDAMACETVVRRLNRFLHEIRVSVDEEGPPAVVQSRPVTGDMIAGYAVCNTSSEEAPLASLDLGVFKFNFRLTTSFCIFVAAIFTGVPSLSDKKGGALSEASFLVAFSATLCMLELFLCDAFLWKEVKEAYLMWIFLNTQEMSLSTFEWLITGKSSEEPSESQSPHVVLVSRKSLDTAWLYAGQVVGLISKEGGTQYALDLVTPDGRTHQLVGGLREGEAVAAAKQLEEKYRSGFDKPEVADSSYTDPSSQLEHDMENLHDNESLTHAMGHAASYATRAMKK